MNVLIYGLAREPIRGKLVSWNPKACLIEMQVGSARVHEFKVRAHSSVYDAAADTVEFHISGGDASARTAAIHAPTSRLPGKAARRR